MNKFLIFFNLAFSEGDSSDSMLSRTLEFRRSLFCHGLAWSAAGNVVILRTETSMEELTRDLVNSIDGVSDFVSVIEIPNNTAIMYGGWLVDSESFLTLLPSAIDVTYENPGPPVCTEMGA
ncbi:MAG: hypothetical protein ACR2F8_00860 [Caulobacteraceae bacterium]